MSEDMGAPSRDGLAGAEAPEPPSRLGPTDGIPSAKPNLECPNCGEGLHVRAASVVDNEQRLTWALHPKEGDLLQAKTVGGTLARMDELLRVCAKEDGGNVRCYVERAYTDEDGAVHFDLAVLPVKKGKRDSDTQPKAGDAQQGSARE